MVRVRAATLRIRYRIEFIHGFSGQDYTRPK
jgi:hypothetical protein